MVVSGTGSDDLRMLQLSIALSVNRLRFVQRIVQHRTANGVADVTRLSESPFTDNAPQGPEMIFTVKQVDGILAILDEVRGHALPDVTRR